MMFPIAADDEQTFVLHYLWFSRHGQVAIVYCYILYYLPKPYNPWGHGTAQMADSKTYQGKIWCIPSGVWNFGTVGMSGTASKK